MRLQRIREEAQDAGEVAGLEMLLQMGGGPALQNRLDLRSKVVGLREILIDEVGVALQVLQRDALGRKLLQHQRDVLTMGDEADAVAA